MNRLHRGLTIILGSMGLLVLANLAAAIEIERSIEYKELADGTCLLADVYSPQESGPRPTLLMIHGGAWFSGNKVHVAYHANYAAEHGFAVVAINYRLAPRHKFPAQLEDCLDALGWITQHQKKYGFDTKRVAVYGYSAGAHLACLVGMSRNEPDLEKRQLIGGVDRAISIPVVRAIVAGGAPCEFSWIPESAKTLAYWLGDSRAELPEIYAAASPLEYVNSGDPPTFLFHGTQDRIVPLQSPQKMAQRLKNAEVPHLFVTIDEGTHIGAFLNRDARAKAIDFLKLHLEGRVDPEPSESSK